MKYDNFTYLYPTRPEQSIVAGLLPYYEKKGWIGQVKKNGTCCIIAVSPKNDSLFGRDIIFMNRHKEDHKAWTPTKEIIEVFSKLPEDYWYYFCGELLHNKVKGGTKNTIYIYDLLVAKSQYLLGINYSRRYSSLLFLFQNGHGIFNDRIEYTDNIWIARCLDHNLYDSFRDMKMNPNPENEGIVLKNMYAPLEHCFHKNNKNGNWQRKCRIPTKNYGS
jgi:hypothetical protein